MSCSGSCRLNFRIDRDRVIDDDTVVGITRYSANEYGQLSLAILETNGMTEW